MSRVLAGGCLAGAFLAVLSARLCEGGRIFSENEVWRYYKGTNTPVNQAGGTNWTETYYVHTSWPQGTNGFGYGDGDDATVLSDMQNNYVSVFTRRRFVITNTAEVTHVTIGADYDDGFVAYINGQEVVRQNMPTGLVTHSTEAAASHESSRSTTGTSSDRGYFDVSPSILVAGSNVLAVSGHNVSPGSTDFSLIIELFTNVTRLRGPMLQMPDRGAVTVAWRTDASTDGVVEYGFDTNYSAGMVSNGSLLRDHAVSLTNLLPGSTYFYRVKSAGVLLSETNRFRAPPGPGQSFTFAVLGDFGNGLPASTAIAARINATNVDLVVTTGDNIYFNGEAGYYDAYWFRPYAPSLRSAVWMPALGNHDTYLGNAIWMAANFVLPTNGPAGHLERVYSYDFGNAHFAVIDTEPFETGDTFAKDAIKTWLSNDLATATQTWKFVQYHRPPHTSQGGHNDQAAVKAEVSPIMEKYGVHFALQGHNHWYERINPINGVNYITSGGGGQGLNPIVNRKSYSAALNNTLHSFALFEINGDELQVRAYDINGSQFDTYNYSVGHPFKMDGLIDNPAWGRATNGLILYAAIKGYNLYVATQDAGEGSDHFLYVATGISTQRPANWGKTGTVMQWSAFLADENDNAFNGWFGASENLLTSYPAYRSMTSGLNNNSTNGNGVLEGSMDLQAHHGSWPQQLYLAGAPYLTSNGGALVTCCQVPAGNGSPNINSGEFLFVSTRDLALDLPVANAGPDQGAEAGMAVALDGSASSVPSGLQAAYSWTQTLGEAVALQSTTSLLTGFTFTNWIDSSTNLDFMLSVSDPRFSSNDTVTVTILPVSDTDGDGLSDQEELTGLNNVLTFFAPKGRVTNPLLYDTDGDGLSDGHESVAGTDPNDASSVLALAEPSMTGGQMVIRWSSVSSLYYTILETTNLGSPAYGIATNILATPPVNTYTASPPSEAPAFHFIGVE